MVSQPCISCLDVPLLNGVTISVPDLLVRLNQRPGLKSPAMEAIDVCRNRARRSHLLCSQPMMGGDHELSASSEACRTNSGGPSRPT